MSRLTPEDLAAVGQHVSDSPAGGISIGALARRLGVSIPTARRRLQASAAAQGLTLQSQPAREGIRGPASARWFLSSASPASPLSLQVRTPEVRPVDALDEAQDAALGLAPAILSALEHDERRALRLLAKSGSACTSELAAQVGRSPDRMEGLMRTLRRKLHRLGSPMIDNETLPDGEAMFRYVKKGASSAQVVGRSDRAALAEPGDGPPARRRRSPRPRRGRHVHPGSCPIAGRVPGGLRLRC